MLSLVLTGGQTGADIAAWRAAKRAGIATSGWCVRGYLAEDGPHPEYRETYHARAIDVVNYAERTRKNVEDADAVLIFCSLAGYLSRGTALTRNLATRQRKPLLVQFYRSSPFSPHAAARWLEGLDVGILLVAGNRESVAPGIGAAVGEYLDEMFAILRKKEGRECLSPL